MSNTRRWIVLALVFALGACTQVREPVRDAPPDVSSLATDTTEAPETLTQSEYAIVAFRSSPAARYDGGIPGLARTRPERGAPFDADSPATRAYLRHLENEHADFRSFLRRGVPGAEIVGEYFLTLNAVAVKLNGRSLRSLQRGPHVRAADHSWLYRPTMDESVGIIGAEQMWSSGSGATGAGIAVGIIDSGIDFDHPFFACKASRDARVYASGVAFDTDNLLVNAHGTHVAGTVAGCAGTAPPEGVDVNGDDSGAGTLSGVAPDAEVRDYNVFPGFGAGYVAYGGSAFSHDIAAAIEDAVADGVDVINMSLGGAPQGPHDFLAEAADAAAEAGVVVVTSAGNSGPFPYTVGSPGTAEKVVTVAATTNAHSFVLGVDVDFGNGATTTVEGAEGDFDPFAESPVTDAPLVLASEHGDALACSALDPVPTGSVILIRRGLCAFTIKVAAAAEAGAAGAIVYNSEPGEGPIAMAGEGAIPAIGISHEAGEEILAGHTADTTVTINGGSLFEAALEPDLLADFSSRGMAPYTGLIKPDLAAPGVNVYSSVFEGGYALYNGTSMAAPHVAGAAALLLEHGVEPPLVKAALVNGAAPLAYAIGETGNGRLDVPAAANLGVLVSPPSVAFGHHNRGGRAMTTSVDVTVHALEGTATCTIEGVDDRLVVDEPAFDVDGERIVTIRLASGRLTDGAEGYLTFDCGTDRTRVPWGVYPDPQGRP